MHLCNEREGHAEEANETTGISIYIIGRPSTINEKTGTINEKTGTINEKTRAI